MAVPLSYMEEFYHLRLHLAMLQQHLMEVRARSEPSAPSSAMSLMRMRCGRGPASPMTAEAVRAQLPDIREPRRSFFPVPPRERVPRLERD